MNENKLSEHEENLFRSLENEMTPPPGLEKDIVAKLIAEGQIAKTRHMYLYIKIFSSAAAAVLIFFAGIYFQKSRTEKTVAINPSFGYMLILHEDQNFKPGNSNEMNEEYWNWMQNTKKGGVKIDGQELNTDAALVKNNKQVTMLQGNYGDKISGYFIIEAKSMEEALEVAKGNPHIKYGGTIEVKSFMGN